MRLKKIKIMEGQYLTSGDLALIENRRGYGYGYGDCGYGYHKGGRGMAATGIGLAAGLGGGALLLGIAGLWGLNQASKARSKGAENLAQANTNYINQIAGFAAAERLSRETWQNRHAPTTTQYVDVQTGAGAFSGAGANANALAAAIAQNSGINSAIGGCNFLRVARFSAPQPCACDSCGE
ncbi:MAG: hypothetical protein IJF01_07180 [Tidjanibacter sp.]|nr:hypothetical protein [Tidjanibacter sp.]